MQAQLDDILSILLDTPPARRSAELDRLCGGDQRLRAEAQRWLDMLPEAEAFFSGIEDFSTGTTGDLCGQRVGAYRITAPIGAGGMGSVYRAERADGEFEGEVAIKFVSPLFGGPGFRRRFQTEKQALAALRHPNIAQLMDAGLAPDGAPYLVMELVEGVSIDRYCEEHKLSLNQRVRLFLDVCSAVSFAHQNLIIHRDLKPANVLVTPAGAPKLLDFGIAKALGGGAAQATLPQERAMTPAYSSPEVVRGEAVSTASDTYSLGILLYELLVGQPVMPANENLTGTLRRVIEWDPPAPSQAAREPRLQRQLRGDLDNIILKAIQKDAAQRYLSVADFADDLRNYLDGRPVAAHAPTRIYWLKKFVRRNRILVAAATVTALVAGAATVSVWRQARIAERERQLAVTARQIAEERRAETAAARDVAEEHRAAAERQRAEAERNFLVAETQRKLADQRFGEVRSLANSVMFVYQNQLAAAGGNTALRAKMASDAITYLDRLAAQKSGDRDLRLEIARGYIQVGQLLGAPNMPNLGDRDGSIRSFVKAGAVLDELTRSHPDFTPARRALADLHCNTANLRRESSPLCLSLWQNLSRDFPKETWPKAGLAAAYTRMAPLMESDNEQRIAMHRRAIEIYEEVIAKDPDNLDAMRNLAINYKTVAGRYSSKKDPEAMLASIQKAIFYDEKRLERFPESPGVRLDLSFDFSMLATYYQNEGRLEDALAQFQRVLDLRLRNFQSDRENTWLQGRVLFAYSQVGWTQAALGKYDAAEKSYSDGLDLARQLKPRPEADDWNTTMAQLNSGLANARERAGAGRDEVCGLRTAALRHHEAVGKPEEPFKEDAAMIRKFLAACPDSEAKP